MQVSNLVGKMIEGPEDAVESQKTQKEGNSGNKKQPRIGDEEKNEKKKNYFSGNKMGKQGDKSGDRRSAILIVQPCCRKMCHAPALGDACVLTDAEGFHRREEEAPTILMECHLPELRSP